VRWWAILGLLAGGWTPLGAQAPGLAEAAESARRAWAAHDVVGVVGSSDRLLLQLPGVAPSGPVERAQAAAMLAGYLKGYEEVTTEIKTMRELGSGGGFVELRRRFRVIGTTEIRSQGVLLSYRLQGARWVLGEVRISG
jgi:hypothetical protein